MKGQFTLVGELPRHHYVWIDSSFTHKTPCGFVPAVWFGLVSFPGRMWGCTVMLESGAIYRNLPPHAISFAADPLCKSWCAEKSQLWDCYGEGFSVIEYDYLRGLGCKVSIGKNIFAGEYLFTAAPIGDGFSASPDQAKEFSFIKLDGDRLTIQPTDRVVFRDKSFTVGGEWPRGLKRQTETYRCE